MRSHASLVQILPSDNNDTDVATARSEAKRGRFMDVVTEDTELVCMREENRGRWFTMATPEGCSPQEKNLKNCNPSSFVNSTSEKK